MIRRATPDDIGALVCLTKRFYEAGPYPDDFDRERTALTWRFALEVPDESCVLVREDLQGVLWFDLAPSPVSRLMLASERIWYVAPEVRGSGLSLLRRAMTEAKAMGAQGFTLSRHALAGGRVHDLYKTLGFEPSEITYMKAF